MAPFHFKPLRDQNISLDRGTFPLRLVYLFKNFVFL